MTKYTREELYDMPISKLVDIIEKLQNSTDDAEFYKRKLARIAMIAVTEPSDVPTGRGRKPFTPEQRAASYEEYKRKKREKYAEMKAEKDKE